jgi:hypothetical protein
MLPHSSSNGGGMLLDIGWNWNNLSYTKELIVDFRKKRRKHALVHGTAVERVSRF